DEAATLPEREFNRLLDDSRAKSAIIDHIGQAEGERVELWLSLISGYPADWRRSIIEADRARRSIVDYYRARIFEAFDPARNRYDYAGAIELVEALEELYPDSANVLEIHTRLEEDRDLALDELRERFDLYLARGLLIPEGQLPHVGEIVDIVRRISPADPLLRDDRLRLRFGELAEQARASGDYDRARALVEAGLAYAPDDAELTDLRFQVDSELARMANERRAHDMETQLRQSAARWRDIAGIHANRADLLALAELRPESPLLGEVREQLRPAVSTEFASLLERGRSDEARALLLDYAPLLGIDFLNEARLRLADAAQGDGAPSEADEEDPRIAERLRTIDELLADPVDGSVWTGALERPYKSLLVLLPPHDALLAEVRERVARHFLIRARRAREAKSFNEADALLAAGRRFHPAFAPFAVESEMVAAARAQQRAKRERERAAALEAALIADFHGKVETNQVHEAKQILAELQELESATRDRFAAEEAPRLLADAYARLAANRARAGEHAAALALARAGLAQWPAHARLVEAVADYQEAVALAE
ncbi:MAG: hypothetical protein R3286_22100, partial [Gammaproteobacteria bacterium]|nr:hypothetical protein [Gammaproteobacteria bacterium]